MSDAAHVLLIGNDGRLLKERAELLTNFWEIVAVSSFDEDDTSLSKADLVVLCHTVTEAQRQAWITRARTAIPVRAIVSLELADPADLHRRNGTDATVAHNRGPAALVSTLYELLNERGLGSKRWAAGGQTLLGADGFPEVVA